jgi:hypothetical protein
MARKRKILNLQCFFLKRKEKKEEKKKKEKKKKEKKRRKEEKRKRKERKRKEKEKKKCHYSIVLHFQQVHVQHAARLQYS